MKTKVSIILVCLIWMASSMYATEYNGVCGENVTWTLDSETKVLTISGTGEMYHDGHFSDALHWQGQNLNSAFQSVVIEPGEHQPTGWYNTDRSRCVLQFRSHIHRAAQ